AGGAIWSAHEAESKNKPERNRERQRYRNHGKPHGLPGRCAVQFGDACRIWLIGEVIERVRLRPRHIGEIRVRGQIVFRVIWTFEIKTTSAHMPHPTS